MEKIIMNGNLFAAKIVGERIRDGIFEYYMGTIDIILPGGPPFFCTFTTEQSLSVGSLEQEILSFDGQPLFPYDKREVYDFFLEKLCEEILDTDDSLEIIPLPRLHEEDMRNSGVIFPQKMQRVF